MTKFQLELLIDVLLAPIILFAFFGIMGGIIYAIARANGPTLFVISLLLVALIAMAIYQAAH